MPLCAENVHTCMQKLASALMDMLLFEHRISPPVLLVPPAELLITSHNRHVLGPGTDMKCKQVLATGKRLFNLAFIAPHTLRQVQWNVFAQSSL